MDKTDIPVIFIKKPNGGVHTARNALWKAARAELIIDIDSDDELTPDACKILIDAWNSIPQDKRNLYHEVTTLCQYYGGGIIGKPFPENANEMTREEYLHTQKRHGERHSLRVAHILKTNLLPEPKGVNNVTEGMLWRKLEQKYKSYAVNKVTRIYHAEGTDHFSNWKKNLQWCKNYMWTKMWMLNHFKLYYDPNSVGMYHNRFLHYLHDMTKYALFREIISKHDPEFAKDYPLEGFANKFLYALAYLPVKIIAPLYAKIKTDLN